MPIFVPTNGGTIDFLAKKVGAHGGTFKISAQNPQDTRCG
jgi:hypothetical protein